MKLFDLAYLGELTERNFKNGDFVFLDIEASGLGDLSYPIEVGWINECGVSDSFLIKPCENWVSKFVWDDIAENAIHHISQKELHLNGIDIVPAATRLNESLQGRLVFCDMLVFDAEWLKILFFEADVMPLFRLADIQTLKAMWGQNINKIFLDICKKQNMTPEHRAMADAERYVVAYKAAISQMNSVSP